MTDKAKRRRRELAETLGVSRRTAANIIKAKTESVRALGCPACAHERNVALHFPTVDLAGCRSGMVNAAPIDRLCARHKQERSP